MSDEFARLLSEGRLAARTARPPKSRLRIWLAFIGLVLYVSLILVITMTPNPVDQGFEGAVTRVLDMLHRNRVPEWFGYTELEFSANIAMFVPLGFLLGLALPRKWQWLGIILLPAFSAFIEWTQLTFLEQRFATIQDVIANSTGGWIGLMVAAMVRAAVYARDEKIVARAFWEAQQHC